MNYCQITFLVLPCLGINGFLLELPNTVSPLFPLVVDSEAVLLLLFPPEVDDDITEGREMNVRYNKLEEYL